MRNSLLFLPFFMLLPKLSAQSCGFSEGKNLAQLQAAITIYDKPFVKGQDWIGRKVTLGQKAPLATTGKKPALFMLPSWSAESLPFFCKIEHDWGKKTRLPFKFRLGSVEYVDWLEGK